MATPLPPESPTKHASAAPNTGGDILDLLKGRGGKIRELEEALQAQKAAVQLMQGQLSEKNKLLATAEAEKLELKKQLQLAGFQVSGAQQDSYNTEDVLSRAVQLDQQVATESGSEVTALQRALPLETEQQQLKAEHKKAIGRLQLDLEAAKLQAQCAKAEAHQRVRQAEAKLELEERRRVADAEEHVGVLKQLQEARMQLLTLQDQLLASTSKQNTLQAQAFNARQPGPPNNLSLASQDIASAHPHPGTGHMRAAGEAEGLAASLSEQLAATQAELAAATSHAKASEQAAQKASARADGAEVRFKQLSKEADALATEVASLREKLGRGEISTGGSLRVLHFKHNPEANTQKAAAEAKLAQLIAENQALTEQLQAGAAGAAGSVELAGKEAQLSLLKRQCHEMEKTMVRLKDVFKERIAVFREACQHLFGYRVDMTSQASHDSANAPTTFTLVPLRAEDRGALLLFRYSKDQGMELLPNAYTAKLGREVNTFVRQFGSISAFTANLTMENFQKHTNA